MTLKDDWANGDTVTGDAMNAVADAVNAHSETLAGLAGITPIKFSAAIAVTGVTGSDRAAAARTLVGARMRVRSAPVGSSLTVVVQHWNGYSWTDLGTLEITDGSVVEDVITFSQAQVEGNLVGLNVTSVGSSSAATGVAVDVVVG